MLNEEEGYGNLSQLIGKYKSDSATAGSNRATSISCRLAIAVILSCTVLAIPILARYATAFDSDGVWQIYVRLRWIVLEEGDIGGSPTDPNTNIGRRKVTEVIAVVAPDTSFFDGVTWHIDVVLCGSACARLSLPVSIFIRASESAGSPRANIERNGHLFIT